MSRIAGNPKVAAGIAGPLVVFIASVLALSLVDAVFVLLLAIVAAFASGLMVSFDPVAAAEREEGHRLSGEFLNRQVRHSRRLSILDPQTALLQRWYFELRIAEEARRCRRYEHTTALILICVDASAQPYRTWTQVDETEFVQLFFRSLRSVDLVARIDERTYGVCLPETTLQGAKSVATRLLQAAGAYAVTAKLALCPGDGMDYDALVARARVFAPPPGGNGASAAVSGGLPLVQLLGTTISGEIAVPQGQTVRGTKAKIRRASRRAGVELRIWEENGAVRFERIEAVPQESTA